MSPEESQESTKTCTKCQCDLPLSQFNKKLSGLTSQCKSCLTSAKREHYSANKERLCEVRRARWQEDKEACKSRNKKYYSANRQTLIEGMRLRNAQSRYGCCHADFRNVMCPIHCHLPATDIDHVGGVGKNLYTRGKISHQANVLLGHFKDDPELLYLAADYLCGEVRSGSFQPSGCVSESRRQILKYQRGLTTLEFTRMLDTQGWSCGICGTQLSLSGDSVACLDHCHLSGRNRGCLCHTCNKGLGYAERPVGYELNQTLSVLFRAAQYIEAYNIAPQAPYKSACLHNGLFWSLVLS